MFHSVVSAVRLPVFIVGILLLPFVQQVTCVDLCSEFDDDLLESSSFRSATPRGGVKAGVYTKDKASPTLPLCLASCCQDVTCDTLFLHDGTCFLIACNASAPQLCEPQHRDGVKFTDTYLISVRTVDPVQGSSTTLRDNDLLTDAVNGGTEDEAVAALLDKLDVSTECTPDTNEGCDENQQCELIVNEEMIGYVCQCVNGMDILGTQCNPVESPLRLRTEDLSCQVGLALQCEQHEDCIPRNSRSRSGTCECDDGYQRDVNTGWCEASVLDVTEPVEEATTIPNVKTTIISDSDDSQTSSAAAVPTSSSASTTTQKPTSSTKPPLEPLIVSAGDNREIQLPDDKVTLFTSTVPTDADNEYTYLWSLIDHPEGDDVGQMLGINTNSLKLSKLIVGLYTFKVTVSASDKYGEAFVNVSVLPPTRENVPPVAIVKPTQQSVNQPNDVVIDGSESSDDDKIVRFHWEQVSGPLNTKHLEEEELSKPMLVIKGLPPGQYVFKLTVTDSDGAENSTFANVTVIKETDYPPKANAGSNVFLSLPQNSVSLYGNASTDDKGIESYEWIKKSDDKLTADMQGVRTKVLQLSNLEEGDYTFTLKVTDTSGQTDTADVIVMVKPEHNKPPVADAGKDKEVVLPVESVSLDGSNSTDDQKIEGYHWQQLSGPSTLSLDNADRAIATVTKLVVGEYKFKLTVKDSESLESSSSVTLTVKQNENKAPVAHAGGDKMVELDTPFISLDGSQSTDDKAIVEYLWTRDDNSLAAGDVLNVSDHRAVLQLANVVAGRYVFTLTVTDAEGLSSTDTASVIVKPDPHENDIVQLTIASDITSFTESNRDNLQKQLALLLHSKDGGADTNVHIQRLHSNHPHQLSLQFFVTMDTKDNHVYRHGPEVVALLKKKLKSEDVLDFSVVTIDTVVCQYNCSGHGRCDQGSKRCICEAFWMENIFDYYILDRDTNCDWSILYVIIVAFLLVVVLAGLTWGVICLCRSPSCCRIPRNKKRHRYTLLEELNDSDKLEMLPKGKLQQSSSLMISESDFSSDEETLFINHRKTNGHVKNGIKPPKGKVKT